MALVPTPAPATDEQEDCGTPDASPLCGLRVLDFGHTVMGPSCGLVLADLGAEVIRIEPPGGERTRQLVGFGAGFFGTYNRNKASLAVDLKHPEGKRVIERLVRTADVLLENFAPGTMDRLGLGWEPLHALNPRLIYCALKGYLPGPYEHLPSLDEVAQMQGGLAYMTGPPGQPLRAGASVVDVMGGLFGAIGILAALRQRDGTGLGQKVHSALFEAVGFLMAQHMAAAALSGEPTPPMTERRSAWAVYDVFAAADGQVFVGVTSDAQWPRFCAAFGLPALADDPALATNNDRVRARETLLPPIRAVLAPLPVATVLERCRAALIPCAPVARPEELAADPHLQASGGLAEVALAGADPAASVRAMLPLLPLHIGGGVPGLRRQPPRVGEDTMAVLASLGYGASEIRRMAAEGIIGLDEDEV
ncbi:CoA transferase [Roseomonas sp. NAR14]|uniref:CoA transferase n=1 Tax=Roseomonas acroporae TaxID=2937791 RepID=A0A9X1YBA5_9PROT|nr:CaiB/BaiF CoA-transferase family protein [Roseomonas acroporae]MCK8785780.1 CoA transferase [Roseomonas acroporae]